MHGPLIRRTRRTGAALLAGGLACGAAAISLAPATSSASSHREAPLTAANPLVDNTDTYAFVSPDNPEMTTLIANWTGFQDPSGGPNFYPFGADGYRYNIKVDSNGDALPDKTYSWTFTNDDKRAGQTFLYNNGPVNSIDDETLLFKQNYKLEVTDKDGKATTLVESGKTAPSNVGEASMPNYAALRDEAIVDTTDGGKSFAGQADDPFFLDLRVFDLLYGTNLKEAGNDTLTGYNVNTIALQVPTKNLTEGGDDSGIIGVWSTTDQKSLTLSPGKAEPTGEFVQVSRLGSPLVNEVVLPVNLKDAFNSLTPDKDGTVMAAVDRVKDPEVPKLIEAIYKLPAPAAPRDDLVAAFLTGIKGLNQPPKVTPSEMLRLNTKIAPASSPNRLAVLAKDTAGFPNGRRLTDDVVDIELQALVGAVATGKIVEALAAGDAVNENDVAFGEAFPYVALPHSGSSTQARGSSTAGMASTTMGSGSTSTAPAGGVSSGFGGLSDEGVPALPVTVALLTAAAVVAGVVLRRRTAVI
ncbi:MAG TPA: DUF4331 domain-containing protein [Mycobacteriales bacterium]|nr:DUF4331 domain-containing protein [Mycobacteriales bacterium]